MATQNQNPPAAILEGKYIAIAVCWLLGNGRLFSWNSMVTVEDYYSYLYPKYHSSRVLTLVYQPFALVTIAVLAYKEAKINARRRNLFGSTSGRGGLVTFIGICAISGAFGVADAHVQSFIAGLAASGALTSALRLITIAAFEDTRNGLRKGAPLFFAISAFFELRCVLLDALVFPKLPIVKDQRQFQLTLLLGESKHYHNNRLRKIRNNWSG